MPNRAEFEPENPEEVDVIYIDEEVPDEDIAATLAEPDPFEKANEEIRGLDGLSTREKKRATRQINKFYEGDGAESTQVEYEPVTGYTFFEVAEPENNLEYLAKLYSISPVHFAAVNAKVANIVGLGYEFKPTEKSMEKIEDLEGDEDALKRARRKLGRYKTAMMDEIDKWNQEDTFTEVMWKVWTDVEATGNGYLEIGRRNNGTVGYIGHIPSHTMRVRLKRDGFIQITPTNKVVYFHNFGQGDRPNPVTKQRTVNEIIHFKKYSTTDSFYGIPDVLAAKNHIAGNEFAARFNLDFFEHKAVPRHLIIVKGGKLSPESEGRLIEFFQTGLKGKHHRTLYVPLPAASQDVKVDFQLEKVESDIQDASFVRYLDSNDDHILMAHRVPRTKVGLASGVSLAVARDADKTFKEQVCRPAQDIIEKKIGRIFKQMTDALEFHLKELTLTDEDTMSKIWERYLRMQVVEPNEVREIALGLKGRKDGDEVVPTFQDATEVAQVKANAAQTRTRDADRSAAASDSAGEARQPKGEGRATS